MNNPRIFAVLFLEHFQFNFHTIQSSRSSLKVTNPISWKKSHTFFMKEINIYVFRRRKEKTFVRMTYFSLVQTQDNKICDSLFSVIIFLKFYSDFTIVFHLLLRDCKIFHKEWSILLNFSPTIVQMFSM